MKLDDPQKQHEWLTQNIPHRLRASVAGTMLVSQLLQTVESEEMRQKTEAFWNDMAIWEGRHSAIRWLIESIGVTGNGDARPMSSGRRRATENGTQPTQEFDVDICDLPGGRYFPLDGEEAQLLAQVWKGASQATAHATEGSNHPSLARDRLVRAVTIVARHLDETVYRQVGQNVRI